MQETQVPSLSREDPLEKGMATHSSVLAWRIQGTKEPGGLQSMGLQRVGHDGATNTNVVQQTPIQQCKAVVLQLSKKDLANSQGFTTQHDYLLRVPKSTQEVCQWYNCQVFSLPGLGAETCMALREVLGS